MKRDVLISRLKQLLNAVDRLEFSVEQNRKQIAETRLLVANVARSVYFAEKSANRKTKAKSSAGAKKTAVKGKPRKKV